MSYSLQPHNGIPIISWYDDRNDNDLERLVPLLKSLALCSDVRNELFKFIHNDLIIWSNVDNYLLKRPDYYLNNDHDLIIQNTDQSLYYNFLTNEDLYTYTKVDQF